MNDWLTSRRFAQAGNYFRGCTRSLSFLVSLSSSRSALLQYAVRIATTVWQQPGMCYMARLSAIQLEPEIKTQNITWDVLLKDFSSLLKRLLQTISTNCKNFQVSWRRSLSSFAQVKFPLLPYSSSISLQEIPLGLSSQPNIIFLQCLMGDYQLLS